MTTLLIALAFTCGLGGGVALTKVKRRGLINVVNEIMLPNPNDERWEIGPTTNTMKCDHLCFKLGEVEICTERAVVRVGGVEIADGNTGRRYHRALLKAQLERKALAAALGDS